jgi:hypothetical protein
MRNIDVIGRNMETLVTFVERAIAKKNTLFRAELELAVTIGTKMRPARTAKNLQESIIRNFLERKLKWCFHIKKTRKKPIYQETSYGKGITPKPKGDRCMSKQSKASLN